jgi:hypothetical protein
MANEPITFYCPACGVQLTIPMTLAGVTGPCPSCQAQIQAPQNHVPPAPAFQPPPGLEVPVIAPPPVVPPPLEAPPQSTAPHDPNAQPAQVRPEPRQLPTRANHAEPMAKKMPEPNSADRPQRVYQSNSSGSPIIKRSLLGLLFLLIALGLIFGLLHFLKNNSQDGTLKIPSVKPPQRTISPQDAPTITPPSKAPAAPAPQPNTQPTSPPSQAKPIVSVVPESTPTPPPSLGQESVSPSQAAREVLDKFLAAKNLAERLPLMETKLAEADLAKTCLAGVLPSTSSIGVEANKSNRLEQVVDLYHSITFETGNPSTAAQTILVRKRGTSEPKVVIDPFLDSFGGRLAAYASRPMEKPGIFQVTISPLFACYEEHVPNREKKYTLKLLPQENSKEIALAYFSKQSKIAQMLEDGTQELRWARAQTCTVLLRWNTEEKAGSPFLEAIDLKALDWNP